MWLAFFRGIPEMERILADRYLAETTKFVRDHIESDCVTQPIREEMISAYQNLNTSNARQTFELVSKLYELASIQAQERNRAESRKVGIQVMLVGAVMICTRWLVLSFIGNSLNLFVVGWFNVMIMLVGLCACLNLRKIKDVSQVVDVTRIEARVTRLCLRTFCELFPLA